MCTPDQADPRFRIRWFTIALVQMDYTCKRLQIPPKAFTNAFGETPLFSHNSPEMVSSAHLFGSVSTVSPLSSVVSPSRRSVGPFTPPLNHRRCTAMLSLRRARRIRSSVCARASHPPLSFPPPPPPFFAPARRIRPFLCLPPSPPPHTMQVALHPRSFFSRCVPCPSPFPPRAPAGVFTHLFFISRGIYRPPLATSPCVRRLTGCCSFLLC